MLREPENGRRYRPVQHVCRLLEYITHSTGGVFGLRFVCTKYVIYKEQCVSSGGHALAGDESLNVQNNLLLRGVGYMCYSPLNLEVGAPKWMGRLQSPGVVGGGHCYEGQAALNADTRLVNISPVRFIPGGCVRSSVVANKGAGGKAWGNREAVQHSCEPGNTLPQNNHIGDEKGGVHPR